ncbi:MAG: hypothetical protein HY791_35795 [Deltaproteobacteria bacterium]|nr:hypothetical protein [Deltaproteobacteria bacterium]
MKPEDVILRMASLVQTLRREQEIRDRLVALEALGANAKERARALGRQAAYLRELEDLRQEQVVPLVEEMVAFIAEKKRELASRPKVARPKVALRIVGAEGSQKLRPRAQSSVRRTVAERTVA